MTRDEFDKFLKALEKVFPPDPEQLQKEITKAQDRLVKEYMQSYSDFQKRIKRKNNNGKI